MTWLQGDKEQLMYLNKSQQPHTRRDIHHSGMLRRITIRDQTVYPVFVRPT